MKRVYLAVFVAGLIFSARAETDTAALRVIRDIQRGENNGNRIESLLCNTGKVLGGVSAGSIGTTGAVTAASASLGSLTLTATPQVAGGSGSLTNAPATTNACRFFTITVSNRSYYVPAFPANQ